MKVDIDTYELRTTVPFAISRGVTASKSICVAQVDYHGLKGLGEASPSGYYGDSLEKARSAIEGSAAYIGDDPFALEAITDVLEHAFPESPSGRAAVETAIYDIIGKMTGQPLFRLFGLAGRTPPLTSLTVGVTDVDLARQRLPFLRAFPVLKVKVGFGDEHALLTLLKNETGAVLRVDANEGWSLEEACTKIETYSRDFSVELFEQPLPKGDIDGYKELKQRTSATVIVDESVADPADIVKWAGLADGINIKLMKCGGIRQALRMVSVARAMGMRVMLGCMVESSLGITAAAHLSPLADYCDLDGNLLIDNDPFAGVRATTGVINLPERPGLGVRAVG